MDEKKEDTNTDPLIEDKPSVGNYDIHDIEPIKQKVVCHETEGRMKSRLSVRLPVCMLLCLCGSFLENGSSVVLYFA